MKRAHSVLTHSILVFAMVGSPLAVHADDGQEFVDIKLDVNLHLRSEEKNMLVSDSVVPAGSVVQVPVDEFMQSKKMSFWKNDASHELEFVKNVKVLKAPGLTKEQVAKLNAEHSGEGLYMAKDFLGDAEIVATTGTAHAMQVTHNTPVFRRDSQAKPEAPAEEDQAPETQAKTKPTKKGQIDKGTAESIVDQVNEGNHAASNLDPAGSFAGCNQDFVKKWVAAGVPAKALSQALEEQKKNPKGLIHNRRYMTIVDFTKPSNERRMFILDEQTGAIQKLYTSNARGSEGGGNKAVRFSNAANSHETPAGFHVTGFADGSGVHTTSGLHHSPKHGLSLLLVGLESKNSNSAARAIEIHKADYASDSFVERYGRAGRSFGCLAIDPKKLHEVLDKIEGGSLVYNYTGTAAGG